MFTQACSIADHFTRPFIISQTHYGDVGPDGQFQNITESVLGALIIINPDGWVLTASHLFDNVRQVLQPMPAARQNNQSENELLAWGHEGARFVDIRHLRPADLAIARLDPFDSRSVHVYPTLKHAFNLSQGTSLCRLGYPFYKVQSTYDALMYSFSFDWKLIIPSFVIEGLYSRTWAPQIPEHEGYYMKFIETSSSPLPSQSGGPVFDRNGTVWSINNLSCSRELRNPHVPDEEQALGETGCVIPEENQYFRTGISPHPQVILDFLDRNNVQYKLSDY